MNILLFHCTGALAGYLEDRLRKRTRRFTCNVHASALFIMQQRLPGQMAFLGLQLWTSRKKQLRQRMVSQRLCPRRGPVASDRLKSNPFGEFGKCRIYSGWGIKAWKERIKGLNLMIELQISYGTCFYIGFFCVSLRFKKRKAHCNNQTSHTDIYRQPLSSGHS